MRSGLRCVVLLILSIDKLFAYFTLFQCKLSFVTIVKIAVK